MKQYFNSNTKKFLTTAKYQFCHFKPFTMIVYILIFLKIPYNSNFYTKAVKKYKSKLFYQYITCLMKLLQYCLFHKF